MTFLINSSMVPKLFDDVVRSIGTDRCHSFQTEHYKYLKDALHEAASDRPALLFRLQFSDFPAEGGVFEFPSVRAYVVRKAAFKPFQEPLDIAVLEDKDTGAHIVLSGETINGQLNYGIAGFELPMQNAQKEVSEILDGCTRYLSTLKEQPGQEALRHELTSIIKPIDRKSFYALFVKPNLSRIGAPSQTVQKQQKVYCPYGCAYQ